MMKLPCGYVHEDEQEILQEFFEDGVLEHEISSNLKYSVLFVQEDDENPYASPNNIWSYVEEYVHAPL